MLEYDEGRILSFVTQLAIFVIRSCVWVLEHAGTSQCHLSQKNQAPPLRQYFCICTLGTPQAPVAYTVNISQACSFWNFLCESNSFVSLDLQGRLDHACGGSSSASCLSEGVPPEKRVPHRQVLKVRTLDPLITGRRVQTAFLPGATETAQSVAQSVSTCFNMFIDRRLLTAHILGLPPFECVSAKFFS